DGGDFGMLQSLLISRYPVITIKYRNANFQKFKQAWSQTVSGNLKLFGFIKLGEFKEGAYGSSFSEGSSNSEFEVKFRASDQVLKVPSLQQSAYVIGGAFQFPGVGKSLVHQLVHQLEVAEQTHELAS
ncbi:MAG: hypothetical protein MI861_22170, partial [Pirellulales bacterium]|nr:hypothetical protein [Pirellulales bacterium]